MLRFLLLLPVIMLMVACSIIGIRSGIEQSHYEVVELLPNNLEIRRYEPRLALETTIQGGDWKNARSQAFGASLTTSAETISALAKFP